MAEIFITDLDKTFLKNDLHVGEFSKEVWNTLTKKGIPLGIATARSLKKSLEFLEGLQLNIPLVLLDGAMVATKEGKVIRVHALKRSTASDIIEIGRKLLQMEPFIVGFEAEATLERFLYPKHLNTFQKQLVASYTNDSRLHSLGKLLPMEHNLKIVYMGTKAQMQTLQKELRRIFSDTIEIKNAPDVYFDCWFLTVLHPKGDKAHALEDVANYMQENVHNMTVFGDSLNDIGMFEKAGVSVAVQNAHERVKQHADVVLNRTNEEEAVAHYLREVIPL